MPLPCPPSKGEASRFTKMDFRREIDKRAQAYALAHGVGFHKAWMAITQNGGEAATLWDAMRKAAGADCTAEEAASTGTARPASPSLADSHLAKPCARASPMDTDTSWSPPYGGGHLTRSPGPQ
jgi:hypothetical protein